jgi:hypothetical protein
MIVAANTSSFQHTDDTSTSTWFRNTTTKSKSNVTHGLESNAADISLARGASSYCMSWQGSEPKSKSGGNYDEEKRILREIKK